MSEPIFINRDDLFGDSVFANEPLTERLAYIWLSAYGPVRQKFGWLARKWQWTPQEVRRFLYKAAGAGLVTLDGEMVNAIDLSVAKPVADPQGWTMTRAAVLARDHYTCVYCGATEDIACDHVHPRSRGGQDTMENLVAACTPCNSSKGGKLLSEWRQ